MKNCIYEPVFGLFLLFNFQIGSALTFSSRLKTELSHIRKLKELRRMSCCLKNYAKKTVVLTPQRP